MMFSIDNIQWNLPCDIERKSEIESSSISGKLTTGEYFNDVIGTFIKYDVKLVANPQRKSDYYALYEAITNPVRQHTFVFPYNGQTKQFVGRVESIRDIYKKTGNEFHWTGISFTVVSNEPIKAPEGGFALV